MIVLRSLAAIGAVGLMAAAAPAPASAELAYATLRDKGGKAVGEVDLVQMRSGVLLRVSIKGLEPGERAFHIHEVGKCEPPFESAGGHFNPTKAKHGFHSGEGHAGDMPNLHVPQSGELKVEVMNGAVTLEKDKPNSLFRAAGTSIVVHAKADDYKSDPSGDAGGRVACGVIQPSGAGATPAPPK